MKKVYIVSHYAGDIRTNTEKAKDYCRFAVSKGYLPFAAHLFFPLFLDEKEPVLRETGIEMGLEMLKTCDEVWVFDFNTISAGMQKEIREAERLGIPIRYVKPQQNCYIPVKPRKACCFEYKHLNMQDVTLDKVLHKGQYTKYYKILGSYVVLDFETTGFTPDKGCEIINIGAAKYRNGELIDTFETLVKPEKEIPEQIEELTDITNSMIVDAPGAKTAIAQLVEFLEDYIIVGHNTKFDLTFLNYYLELFRYDEFITKYCDTLTIARSFRSNNKLETLVKDYINPEYVQSHTAFDDVENTAKLFQFFQQNNNL